jgi:hypothetical protein
VRQCGRLKQAVYQHAQWQSDQDDQRQSSQGRADALKALAAGSPGLIYRPQTVQSESFGWRGAAPFKVAQHVVDQAHTSISPY